jgi:uncharacterized membrane protein YeaQ/YmgE (transglycosylase-associated protein family)
MKSQMGLLMNIVLGIVGAAVASAILSLCVPNIRFSMDAENRRGKFAT